MGHIMNRRRAIEAAGQNLVAQGAWFVAQTKPRKEQQAFEHLKRQGFVPFLPKMERTVRHARQFKSRIEPLFPGYIFVSFGEEHARWRSVNGTLGVVCLISSGDKPQPVPDAFMQYIVACTDAEGLLDSAVSEYDKGQSVKIQAGPFAGMTAEVKDIDGPGRVHLLLEVMGREVETTISPSSLLAVG